MKRFYRGFPRLALVLSIIAYPIFIAEVYTYNNQGQAFQGWDVWPDAFTGGLAILAIIWSPWLLGGVFRWIARGFARPESDTRAGDMLEFMQRRELADEFGDILMRCRQVQALPQFLPATHFAPPAAEARRMYRFGYYYGAIITCQATAEALARFIAEAKGMDLQFHDERDERNGGVRQEARIEQMKQAKAISGEAFGHFRRILDHQRNSFHHMTSAVAPDRERLREMALECVQSLYSIEGAFLKVGDKGRVHVSDHELWSVGSSGEVACYVDCKLV